MRGCGGDGVNGRQSAIEKICQIADCLPPLFYSVTG
jgi:hypothetical protein